MTRLHHPKTKAERLNVAQKKERSRLNKENRASRVRAKLAREQLKAKELEDEVSKGAGNHLFNFKGIADPAD